MSRIPISVIVTRYPWVVPVIYILKFEKFDRKILSEKLGICSRFSRTLIWILKKLNIVVECEDGMFKIDPEVVDQVCRKVICVKDRRFVIQEGDSMILVRLLNDRATVRVVSRDLVDLVEKKLKDIGRESNLKTIADSVGERADRVSTALRILETCGKVIIKRDESGRCLYMISH